jgi:hypothetical protein
MDKNMAQDYWEIQNEHIKENSFPCKKKFLFFFLD